MSDYQKNIGTVGSISLLISSITGPGIIQLPVIFQTAGWLLPTIAFIVIPILATLGSLFLMEAMTYFPENEDFGRNTELTVLVHHFYGRRWYYLAHILVYGSLQSFNIASMISGIQQFDQLLVSAFGETCGFGLSPISGLYCSSGVSSSSSASPFGDNYMLITLGGLILLAFLLPLISLNLSDNMIVQFISIAYLSFVILCWIIIAFVNGLNTRYMPTIGPDTSQVLGSVLFNYTLANTVPSWVNGTHPSVNLKRALWYSVIVATSLYFLVGFFGALGFYNPTQLDIMTLISTNPNSSQAAIRLNNIFQFTFPILVYITSIPVSMIIVRLNLQSSGLLGKSWSDFCAVVLPMIICIPFQTSTWLNIFANWTSLIFQTLCNFIMPFMIFIFTHKRNLELRQSVIDELDFLDLGGLDKSHDDEGDFVYHLPHANEEKIVPHTSISDFGDVIPKETLIAKFKSTNSIYKTENHRALVKALDPNFSGKRETIRARLNARNEKMGGSQMGSRFLGSRASKMGSNASQAFGMERRLEAKRGSAIGGGGLMPAMGGGGRKSSYSPGASLGLSSGGADRRASFNPAGTGGGSVPPPLPPSFQNDRAPSRRGSFLGAITGAPRIIESGENDSPPAIQITIPDIQMQVPDIVTSLHDLDHHQIDETHEEYVNVRQNRDIGSAASGAARRRPSVIGAIAKAISDTDFMDEYEKPSSSQQSRRSGGGGLSDDDAPLFSEDFKMENESNPKFYALPQFIRKRVPSKLIALICMIIVAGLAFYVLAQNILALLNPTSSISSSTNTTSSVTNSTSNSTASKLALPLFNNTSNGSPSFHPHLQSR